MSSLADDCNSALTLKEQIWRAFRDHERLALAGGDRLDELVKSTLAAHKIECISVDLIGLQSVLDLCTRMIDEISRYVSQQSVFSRTFVPRIRGVRRGVRQISQLVRECSQEDSFVNSGAGTHVMLRLLDHIEALSRHAPLAVCFGEFEEIRKRLTRSEADYVLGILRSRIQRQADVAYFFTGSDILSLSALFVAYSEPFFGGAIVITVEP